MANSRAFLRREQAKGGSQAKIDCQEVAHVAYELYEQRGREDGQDLEDWLRAEVIVRQRQGGRSRA